MKKILMVIVAMMVSVTIMGCSMIGNYSIASYENATDSEKSSSYKKLQGDKEYNIKVGSNGATIRVDIVSESGTLDVKIVNSDDETDVPYEGKNLPTGTFSVNISNQGTYQILLTAENHEGSYCFKMEDLSEDSIVDIASSQEDQDNN